MERISLTESEVEDLAALGSSFGILGQIFMEGAATMDTLRMAAASVRAGADVLDAIVERMEAN